MNKCNEEQLRAINIRNKNVLVSAGAGSGKTMVLANRVLSLLKDGYSLDNMLILTFTKNAAQNMKTRIKKLINEVPSLTSQLSLVDGTDIETFDAFNKKLANKYRVKLGLTDGYDIGNETTFDLLKRKFIIADFEKRISSEDKEFISILDNYTDTSYDNLFNLILKIEKSIEVKRSPREYLSEIIAHPQKFSFDDLYKDIYDYFYLALKEYYKSIITLYETEPCSFLEEYSEKIKAMLSSSSDFDSLKSCIAFSSLPRMKKDFAHKEEFKAKRDKLYTRKIKGKIETIPSKEVFEMEYQNQEKTIRFIYREVVAVYDYISSYKDAKRIYSFTDIAQKVLNLIRNDSEIRNELKNHYQEIMVDEYQDNSDMQEDMINMLENNNLFLVGDIKQSIYRFRNANPSLFMKRYSLYKNDSSKGEVIDMNRNYRSSNNVISHINTLFSEIMNLSFGGADYKSSHTIICANSEYQEKQYSVRVLKVKEDADEDEEIYLVAQDIKSRIQEGKVKYEDFALILDRTSKFSRIIKIFNEEGIPLSVTFNADLTSLDFINLLIDLLKILSCFDRKDFSRENFVHPYLAISRSFIIGRKDEELYHYINEDKYLSDPWVQKAHSVFEEYRDYPIDVQFSAVLKSLNILERINSDEEFEDDMNQLLLFDNALVELASLKMSFAEAEEYFSSIKGENLKYQAKFDSSVKSSVTLIDIHMSKGLEYNHCYFLQLKKNYFEREYSSSLSYSDSYGAILPLSEEKSDKGYINPLLFMAKLKETHASREEKIRLLYVALTRAKLSMTFVEPFEHKEITSYSDAKSFDEILAKSGFYTMLTKVEHINVDTVSSSKENLNVQDFGFIYKTLDEIKEEKKETIKRASKTTIHASRESLKLGTSLHEILQVIDFVNPDYSFIKVKRHREMIQNFLSQDFLGDLKNAKIYKEFQFFDDINNTNGVIDLLIIYEDHALIVDYKLKDISDEEYKNQLQVYSRYIRQVTSLPVDVILYSLILKQYEILKV